MTYKNLLVHLDDSKSCRKRLAVALDLAQRFDAHLVGLYVAMESSVPAYVMAQIPAETIDLQRRLRGEATQKAAAFFEEEARRAGRTVEFRQDAGYAEEVPGIVALHGRYSDLVILGQHDPDDGESLSPGTVEHIVLGSGQPNLIVPYIGAPANFGQRIIVAWDSGREAARAVRDALPLLARAKQVLVLAVNPRFGLKGHGEEPGADIALAIARHGVKAEAQHVTAPDLDVADLLLSRVADENADLVVMGGYGHARLRELVLGGVTRHMLEHMTVPLLMSH